MSDRLDEVLKDIKERLEEECREDFENDPRETQRFYMLGVYERYVEEEYKVTFD